MVTVMDLFSTTGLAVLTILFGVLGFGLISVGLKDNQKRWLKVLAVFTFLGAVWTSGMLGGLAPSAPATASTATYSIVVTEDTDKSWVTVDLTNHKININFEYNTTSNAFTNLTGTGEVNFTLSRTDSSTVDAVTTANLGTVQQVPDLSGNGKTYSMIALNGDGTRKCVWEKGPDATAATSTEFTTVLVPGGGNNFVRLNITLNPDAAENLAVFGNMESTVNVGGETWTVSATKIAEWSGP